MGSTNMQFDVMVLNLEDQIRTASVKSWGKAIQGCSPEELYTVMQLVCKRILRVLERNTGEKKIYYVSAEFMVGRMLVNNLMNLGIYDAVEKILQKYGKSLSEIGEYEPEPHLGFGSPGRLAACMMDSIATLGLNGEGIGLYYHASGREGWENLSPKSFEVDYGSISVTSRLYNLEMVGYMSGRNRLRLFDVAGMDTSRYNGELGFDAAYFKENPPLFLHPDDTDATGRKLRLYQQYFLASSAAQLILRDMKNRKYDLYRLGEYAVIQINDTYPGLIIPELIRILITRTPAPIPVMPAPGQPWPGLPRIWKRSYPRLCRSSVSWTAGSGAVLRIRICGSSIRKAVSISTGWRSITAAMSMGWGALPARTGSVNSERSIRNVSALLPMAFLSAAG